jgi:hypothetical protein
VSPNRRGQVGNVEDPAGNLKPIADHSPLLSRLKQDFGLCEIFKSRPRNACCASFCSVRTIDGFAAILLLRVREVAVVVEYGFNWLPSHSLLARVLLYWSVFPQLGDSTQLAPSWQFLNIWWVEVDVLTV